MGQFLNPGWAACLCTKQSGAWALEKSLTRPSFFLYFREIRKKGSHWPGGQSAPRLYNRCNLCPCAGPHMWASAAVARVQVLQNSGSWMVVLRFTTLSARDSQWRNLRKKNYRERSNIKSACQSTDGLSATQNGRGAAERTSYQDSKTYRRTHWNSP